MEGTPEFEARPGGIDPAELLESVIFEDGLDAAIELASHPHLVPGANPVTIMLIISKILSAHAYELLGQDDPFAVDEPDALLGYDLFPETTAPAVPAGSAPFTAAAGAAGGSAAVGQVFDLRGNRDVLWMSRFISIHAGLCIDCRV